MITWQNVRYKRSTWRRRIRQKVARDWHTWRHVMTWWPMASLHQCHNDVVDGINSDIKKLCERDCSHVQTAQRFGGIFWRYGDSNLVSYLKLHGEKHGFSLTRLRYDLVESRYNVLSVGSGKCYIITIVRCIRTENFPLREIVTWVKVRYNGGYVVRCKATWLYKWVSRRWCGTVMYSWWGMNCAMT